MFSPRSADTYTKEWPSGGDQGPVLLCSVWAHSEAFGTVGTRPKRPFGPLRDVKRLLNPIRLAHSGRMTVEVLIGLWDMRMLIDMHSRGATDLRASTAEHAGVFGPDAAAAAPTVATFEHRRDVAGPRTRFVHTER